MNNDELTTLGYTLGTVVMLGAIVLNRKFRQTRNNKLIFDELLRANRRELYLASLLDKHGIELTEFDIIAINES